VTRSPKTQKPAQVKEGNLSNFLCFAVYSANLAFGRAYKPILDAAGLTYTQYIAMVGLLDADEQTVSELGEKLFLESNTLTPILKKLEQIGYISRTRDPDGAFHDTSHIPRGSSAFPARTGEAR